MRYNYPDNTVLRDLKLREVELIKDNRDLGWKVVELEQKLKTLEFKTVECEHDLKNMRRDHSDIQNELWTLKKAIIHQETVICEDKKQVDASSNHLQVQKRESITLSRNCHQGVSRCL